MSAQPNSDVTLLTEHLQFRPVSLIDDIINSINILSYRACDAVEKGLLDAEPATLGFKIPLNAPPETAASIATAAKHEIENGVHQLETLLEAKIDKNFDKLEIYTLRNTLSVTPEVRDWVRLSHYESLNFTTDKDAPTTESITMQRRKVRETQKLHAWLKAESARNEATIATLKTLVLNQNTKHEPDTEATYPALAFLQNKGDLKGDVKHPITTTTEFALSQLPALKSLLEVLEPRLQTLKEGDGNEGIVGDEEKTWRMERLEFIEKETKRHLESVRGLELGEMGEVRDGEWQGQGRKLGKGEVEDLERVVGLVGHGKSDPMDQS